MIQSDLSKVWLDQLRSGDSQAAQKLWDDYFVRLCEIARTRIRDSRELDEEDVALSALKSFYLRVQDGEYSRITDPTTLWPLLVAITKNKIVDQIRRENRIKRGGTGSSDRPREMAELVPLSQLLAEEPQPEFVTELGDELKRLLGDLAAGGDDRLHQIVLWKLEGLSNVEIASELSCSRRTVERKLELIAELWIRELQS